MRKNLVWLATAVATFLALYAMPILATWKPGHG